MMIGAGCSGAPGAADVSLMEPWATGMVRASTEVSGLAGSVGSDAGAATGAGVGATRCLKKERSDGAAEADVDNATQRAKTKRGLTPFTQKGSDPLSTALSVIDRLVIAGFECLTASIPYGSEKNKSFARF